MAHEIGHGVDHLRGKYNFVFSGKFSDYTEEEKDQILKRHYKMERDNEFSADLIAAKVNPKVAQSIYGYFVFRLGGLGKIIVLDFLSELFDWRRGVDYSTHPTNQERLKKMKPYI